MLQILEKDKSEKNKFGNANAVKIVPFIKSITKINLIGLFRYRVLLID